MSFRVNQKVVCIKACYDFDAPPPYPPIGTVATVSWVQFDDGDLMIDLLEFPSPETDEFDRGYFASHWRPIVERKTSIEIFTSMLNPSKVDA